ncbi:MAG: SGNH/GDSL hydrolase family protein [Planctomycetota bacterium]
MNRIAPSRSWRTGVVFALSLFILSCGCSSNSTFADESGADGALETSGSSPVRRKQEQLRVELTSAKRIVFLGDSITYDGRYVSQFEAWLIESARRRGRPDDAPKVINVGLPSETVSGLSEDGHAGGRFPRPDLFDRLDSVLSVTKPDWVVACYGINCGIYQPFDESRFQAYQQGINRLHRDVEKTGAKILHVTPPAFDQLHFTTPIEGDYNEVMQRYSKWVLQQQNQGWHVVDLHRPMTEAMLRARAVGEKLQRDGVHPNDKGHDFIAGTLIEALGGTREPTRSKSDSATLLTGEQKQALQRRMMLLRDAYLTAAGHDRPGIKPGLPIEQAESQAARIK